MKTFKPSIFLLSIILFSSIVASCNLGRDDEFNGALWYYNSGGNFCQYVTGGGIDCKTTECFNTCSECLCNANQNSFHAGDPIDIVGEENDADSNCAACNNGSTNGGNSSSTYDILYYLGYSSNFIDYTYFRVKVYDSYVNTPNSAVGKTPIAEFSLDWTGATYNGCFASDRVATPQSPNIGMVYGLEYGFDYSILVVAIDDNGNDAWNSYSAVSYEENDQCIKELGYAYKLIAI